MPEDTTILKQRQVPNYFSDVNFEWIELRVQYRLNEMEPKITDTETNKVPVLYE